MEKAEDVGCLLGSSVKCNLAPANTSADFASACHHPWDSETGLPRLQIPSIFSQMGIRKLWNPCGCRVGWAGAEQMISGDRSDERPQVWSQIYLILSVARLASVSQFIRFRVLHTHSPELGVFRGCFCPSLLCSHLYLTGSFLLRFHKDGHQLQKRCRCRG